MPNQDMDIFFLDRLKTFDEMYHRLHLAKLEAIAISPTICEWLVTFLGNHSIRVGIEETFMFEPPICTGVPKVSILGPLLFIFNICSLPVSITLGCYLFADYVKLICPSIDKVIPLEDFR